MVVVLVVVVVAVVSTFDEVMVLAEVMVVVSSNTDILGVVNLSFSLFVVVISTLGLIFGDL